MLYLAAPQFDLSGLVALDRTHSSDSGPLTRRGGRAATLDGGAEILDLGYSDADRTFSVTARQQTREAFDAVAYLLRSYPLLLLSCEYGLFYGALRDLRRSGADIVFDFLVLSKLTED